MKTNELVKFLTDSYFGTYTLFPFVTFDVVALFIVAVTTCINNIYFTVYFCSFSFWKEMNY